MKKHFMLGAVSIGLLTSSISIQPSVVAAASNIPTSIKVGDLDYFYDQYVNIVDDKPAFEEEQAVDWVEDEDYYSKDSEGYSFKQFYRDAKLQELYSNSRIKKVKMNANRTEILLTINVAGRYFQYNTQYGGEILFKIKKRGELFDVETVNQFDWDKLIGDDKQSFVDSYVGEYRTDFLNEWKWKYETPYTDTDIWNNSINGGYFTDTIGHWAENYIQFLYTLGIINGKTLDSFDPNGQVTRGQLAVMVVRAMALDSEVGSTGPTTYTDVEHFWGKGEIAALQKLNMLDIFTGTKFEPNKPVTREEMAYVTAHALFEGGIYIPEEELLSGTNSFKDISKMNKKAISSIGILERRNYIQGQNGNFNPKGQLTRGELAKILTLVMHDYNAQNTGSIKK